MDKNAEKKKQSSTTTTTKYYTHETRYDISIICVIFMRGCGLLYSIYSQRTNEH